jgi:hypothetical protein
MSSFRRWARRRRALGLAAVSVAALAIVLTQSVLAVHDLAFQLDGDVSASTTTSVGGHTQPVDWSSLFNADTTKKSLPGGFTAVAFSKDFQTTTKKGVPVFATADATTFATGSKDTLDINPGWQCSPANNLLSKNDIMNAYTAAYTDPTTSHQILYFALERNSNNGDANVAFWFLQGGASCDSSSGTATWVGHHQDGDILIVSAFTNGGGVSGIDAYRWNGGATGSLGTTSVAHGSDCNTTGGIDAICATTNGSAAPGLDAAIQTPWQTANATDNLGTTLQPSEFFEGGIDLTAKGLGNRCFNTFVGDTRSSQSLTATIFDYAEGTLGECSSSTVTQAKNGAGANLTSASIPATGTLSIKDTATVTVQGVASFSGNVQFYLCGPSSTSITSCNSSTGTAIGSAHAITTNGSVDQTASLTSAGNYCWGAVFSGDADAGVPGSHDNGANECFVVNALQPTLTTQATTGPVDFGSNISDTATLAGTANKPGSNGVGTGGTINATRGGVATGNITITAYGPDSCSVVAYGPVSLAASGDNSVGGPGSTFEFKPAAPGQYVFVASYAGDAPNTLGVPAVACASQPSNEKVTVQQIPTSIATHQSWYPNDTATISSTVSGNTLGANGSVTFSLYAGSACSGTAFYSETKAVSGGVPSQSLSTSNTTVPITTLASDAAGSTTGTYSWKVTYAPNASDTAHLGIQSACSAENFNITYSNDNGPGTAFP